MKYLAISIVLLCGPVLHSGAQFISTIWEYVPAPGQHINTSWGVPDSTASLVGGIHGGISLGAFGGYIVFSFEQPVENDPGNPYGIDFTIFGNPLPHWSEPGVVSVMQDKNGNGLPDDIWYELAGSDHFFTTTERNYQVTYFKPEGAADVPWADSHGNQGVIAQNDYHTQPYYPSEESFPGTDQEKYTLTGTLISSFLDNSNPVFLRSSKHTFGYADNLVAGDPPYDLPDNPYTPATEHSGGDGFDIDWAIDGEGNYADLEHVDFIRVQTAVLPTTGYLGEQSTEIRGAVDIPPTGRDVQDYHIISIRDIPDEIPYGAYPLEAASFLNGKYQHMEEIVWSCDRTWAHVNEDHILNTTDTGLLTISAFLVSDPSVSTSIETRVVLPTGTVDPSEPESQLIIYPNPATHYLRVDGRSGEEIQILDSSGRVRITGRLSDNSEIDVSGLGEGIYFVIISSREGWHVSKLLIGRP